MNTALKIRPLGLAAALVPAAILPTLLLGAAVVIGGGFGGKYVAAMGLLLATNGVMWLIGAGALAAITAWRTGVRLFEVALLGAGLAFISPLVSILVGWYIAPLMMTGMNPSVEHDIPFGICMIGGVIELPFGWAGGWIVWRLGFPVKARVTSDDGRHTRTLDSLSFRRILLSLCLLPLLPATVIAGFMILYAIGAYAHPWVAKIWWHVVGLVVFAALSLTIVGGMVFVFRAPRHRRRISRGGCLALGCAVSLLLPSTCAVIGTLLSGPIPSVWVVGRDLFEAQSIFQSAAMLYIIGAVLVPLGLPGGWLFWRLGVAPAPQPLPLFDPAEVFG
jgi:hypothetical protein